MGERFELALHQKSYTDGNKHLWRCSMSLIIWERQIKATWDTITNLSEWLIKKILITASTSENAEKLKFSHILLVEMQKVQLRSDQISRSVVSDSLWPHESQHARPPCPSPTPGVHSDSRPSSQWCHPAISSSVPFSSCPQSLPASESFPMSQLFAWGG